VDLIYSIAGSLNLPKQQYMYKTHGVSLVFIIILLYNEEHY